MDLGANATEAPALRSVVHDLRNSLAALVGNLDLLANGCSDPAKPLRRAFAAAERAQEQLDQLSRLSSDRR